MEFSLNKQTIFYILLYIIIFFIVYFLLYVYIYKLLHYFFPEKIEGFDEITTNLFTNNFDEFIKLFKKLPSKLQKQLLIIKEKQNVNNRFKNLKIVFSGFRNKEWEQIIEEEGGKVVSTISKNTNILIAKKEDIEDADNSKIKKALELKIKILTPEEFDKEYFT